MGKMGRPKGSKNKKTLAYEALIDEHIANKQVEQKQLEKEIRKIQKEIDSRRVILNRFSTKLRQVNRELASMEARRDEINFDLAEKAKMQEIEARVAQLIKNGMSADDILKLTQTI